MNRQIAKGKQGSNKQLPDNRYTMNNGQAPRDQWLPIDMTVTHRYKQFGSVERKYEPLLASSQLFTFVRI